MDDSKCSILDLAFLSCSIALEFSFFVLLDSYGSDHLPIMLSSNHLYSALKTRRLTVSIGGVNWKLFSELADRGVRDIIYDVSGKEAYNLFLRHLRACLQEAGGYFHDTYHPGLLRPPSVWWNLDCNKIMKEKRMLYRKFIDNPSLDNLKAYKFKCKEANRVTNHAKKESFKEFCNSLTPFTDVCKVWSTLRAFKDARYISPCNVSEVSRSLLFVLSIKSSLSRMPELVRVHLGCSKLRL